VVSPGPRGPKTQKSIHLVLELVKRDFRTRFTGSALGVFWAVLQPLSLVFTYWFVFTYMFTPRGATPSGNYVEFLIAGLLPWIGINEGLVRSTTSIVDNAAVVRKLALRSEVLVIVPNVSALLFESIAIGLFVLFLLARGASPALLWVLPLVLLLQLALQVGCGLFLAATYVFFRDLTPILAFVLSIVFYLSPILYPVGGRFAAFFAWNPMTPLLGLFRSALLSAALPPPGSIVFVVVVAGAALGGGLLFFRRLRSTLADLI
jgi:ABC-type polysaccharide/polyol phosphate export permease